VYCLRHLVWIPMLLSLAHGQIFRWRARALKVMTVDRPPRGHIELRL
jgi:hypothetical protein